MEKCKFDKAWIGQCKNEADESGFCEEHKGIKCVSCGAQATHECGETGQFVCGAPLCDDCEHTHCDDGTNGNIGFFRTAALPEGYKSHCKKSEQKYFPWYVSSYVKDYPELQVHVNDFKAGKLSYLEALGKIDKFCEEQSKKEE